MVRTSPEITMINLTDKQQRKQYKKRFKCLSGLELSYTEKWIQFLIYSIDTTEYYPNRWCCFMLYF